MRIEDRSIMGWVNKVLPEVWQRVCGFLSGSGRIYFGATSDYRYRADRHVEEDDGWSKMVLLFRTSSVVAAAQMERELIRKSRESNFRLDPENIGSGGEGLREGYVTYWVYALIER